MLPPGSEKHKNWTRLRNNALQRRDNRLRQMFPNAPPLIPSNEGTHAGQGAAAGPSNQQLGQAQINPYEGRLYPPPNIHLPRGKDQPEEWVKWWKNPTQSTYERKKRYASALEHYDPSKHPHPLPYESLEDFLERRSKVRSETRSDRQLHEEWEQWYQAHPYWRPTDAREQSRLETDWNNKLGSRKQDPPFAEWNDRKPDKGRYHGSAYLRYKRAAADHPAYPWVLPHEPWDEYRARQAKLLRWCGREDEIASFEPLWRETWQQWRNLVTILSIPYEDDAEDEERKRRLQEDSEHLEEIARDRQKRRRETDRDRSAEQRAATQPTTTAAEVTQGMQAVALAEPLMPPFAPAPAGFDRPEGQMLAGKAEYRIDRGEFFRRRGGTPPPPSRQDLRPRSRDQSPNGPQRTLGGFRSYPPPPPPPPSSQR